MNTNNNSYKNTIWLIVLSFLLKGIGFVNRMVIAYYFGTTARTDIYYVASGFIDSLSSVILASFSVGIISTYIKEKQYNKSNAFVTKVIVFVQMMMFGLMIISLVFAAPLSNLLAPKLSGVDRNWLIKLIQILSLVMPFIGISSVFSSALQAESKFTPVKLMGSITSIVSIISTIILSPIMNENSLVISYLISNILNALFLAYSIRKLFKFSFKDIFIKFKEIEGLVKLSIPLLIALAAHEINLMIDRSLATQIEVGAVSALSYSSVLYLFLENIIINSVVTVVYPNLAKKKNSGKFDEVASVSKKTIYYTELLLIPLVVVFFFCSTDIIGVLFQRGQFDSNSLYLTSIALRGYILGLPFLAIRDIITRVFYAYEDTKTPMLVNAISVLINIILDFVLGYFFGIMGITLATSISLVISSLMMFKLVRNKNEKIKIVNFNFIFRYLLTIILICIIENYVSLFVQNRFFSLILSTLSCFMIEILYLIVFDKATLKLIVLPIKNKIIK